MYQVHGHRKTFFTHGEPRSTTDIVCAMLPESASGTQKHPFLKVSAQGQPDGTILVGPVPVPGTYSIEYGYPSRRFEAQRIEKNAREKVIEWHPQSYQNVYKGRAVDTRDGSPIAGAYVMLGHYNSDVLQRLSQAELDTLWEGVPDDGTSVFATAEMKRKFRDMYDLQIRPIALARTTAEGTYTVKHPKAHEPTGLMIHSPGMLTVVAYGHHFHARDLPDRKPSYTGIYPFVHFEAPEEWRFPEPPSATDKDAPWRPLYHVTAYKADQDFTLNVPALVVCSVHVKSRDPVVDDVSWENIGPLSPGQRLQLAPKELMMNRPFLIKVTHENGEPARGILVRVNGKFPLITDENGTTLHWTDGSIGSITVYGDPGGILVRKRNITIPPTDPVIHINIPGQTSILHRGN